MLTTLARLLLAVLTFPVRVLFGGRSLAADQQHDDDAARDAHHRLHRERPQ